MNSKASSAFPFLIARDVLFWAGLALLTTGLWTFDSTQISFKRSVTAKATITETSLASSGKTSSQQWVVYSFVADGKVYQGRGATTTSGAFSYWVPGKTIDVVYDRADPRNNRLAAAAGFVFHLPLLASFGGVVLLGISLCPNLWRAGLIWL